MNKTEFYNKVRASEFNAHFDYIESLIQPSIEIKKIANKKRGFLNKVFNKPSITEISQPGNSKLGGNPDLPQGFAWPEHKHGLYRFVGQFNLDDIIPSENDLPEEGLLSIFVADDYPDYESEEIVEWFEDGYTKVYWFSSTESLRPQNHPIIPEQPSVNIKLTHSISLPLRRELYKESSLSENEIDSLSEFLEDALDMEYNYLMGYPFYSRLAYDPTPDENWISLLTLSSNEQLDWCWNDDSFLMLFIEKEKLKNADFSNIKAEIG